MIRFNYLRDSRNPLERIRRIEVTPRVRVALGALAFAVLAVAFGCVYAHVRLAQEIAASRDAADRAARDAVAVRGLRRSIATVADLDALAGEIRTIRRSGPTHGTRVVEIADLLPAHVWLTTLDDTQTTQAIGGETHDYTLLAETLRRLARARSVGNPLLTSSRRKDDAGDVLEFAIALTGKTP